MLSSGGYAGFHEEGPVKGPGLVIGRATNLGVPTWSEGDYWPLNTTLFVKDFHGNDPRFVYYLLQTMDLSGYNSGSVQPMLNRNYVANVPVIAPVRAEQEAISSVLRALDDKVQSDQRIAQTARALGAALFEGAIGRDSHVLPLSDVSRSIARGIAPKYRDADPTAALVLNQRCVRGGFVTTDSARRMEPRNVAPERMAQRGDVLVNSTSIHRRVGV